MWQYNYSSIDNSNYLMHRSHKYTSKKMVNGKMRYYYGNEPKGRTAKNKPANNQTSGSNKLVGKGGSYELDAEDRAYLDAKAAGTDTRTTEQYLSDKKAKQNQEAKAARQSQLAKERAAKEEERKKNDTKENRRKYLKEDVVAAGKAFVSYYF